MDIFAHFLWTFAVYFQHPRRWIAGAIGVLPDLFAFAPYVAGELVSGTLVRGPPVHMQPWVSTLYSISHSLVVLGIVALLLWYLARGWFWLLGGWLLHIIIDIPTHTREFFATPFLWPISGISYDGISWAAGWFMALNYGALAAVYLWLWLRVRPAKKTVLS